MTGHVGVSGEAPLNYYARQWYILGGVVPAGRGTRGRSPRDRSSAGGDGQGGPGRIFATVLAIFALAWLLRFLYVLDLRASPLVEAPMLDELYYVQWATALAGGDWIGTEAFFRGPLYPYLLGVVFALFKGSVFAARIVQVTYGALTPGISSIFVRT